MKIIERVILAIGLATIGFLLWTFNPLAIWAMISQIGLAGFLIILPFQAFDHYINALGWRFAFSAEDSRRVSIFLLMKARIAGDGVNYLTPSASIAGELIRPGMLGDVAPAEVKNTSVVVAKLSQAMGQALFICLGLVFVLQGKLDFLRGNQRIAGITGTLLVITGVCAALWVLTSESAPASRLLNRFGPGLLAVRQGMREYLRAHPGRFALSIFFFMLGYAWGALEVLLICSFMGISIAPMTALAVEVLSNLVDSLMFMVPAKVGTQEAGKTAIFAGLGYAGSQGLAFGLIRHTREIFWAGLGLGLYGFSRRRNALLSASLPPDPAPAARGD